MKTTKATGPQLDACALEHVLNSKCLHFDALCMDRRSELLHVETAVQAEQVFLYLWCVRLACGRKAIARPLLLKSQSVYCCRVTDTRSSLWNANVR